ncbi:MAG: hypothetical protein GC191_09520 [Azospirillum sp.]|nr:hypothetical protein [Azospirillum sp.]
MPLPQTTLAVWPPELPRDVMADGWQETLALPVIRTQMEAGPAKQRRRYSAATPPVTATYLMEQVELELLQDFIDETLGGGALAFEWPHPRTGLTVTARLVGGSEPQVTPSGAQFLVRLTLEVQSGLSIRPVYWLNEDGSYRATEIGQYRLVSGA